MSISSPSSKRSVEYSTCAQLCDVVLNGAIAPTEVVIGCFVMVSQTFSLISVGTVVSLVFWNKRTSTASLAATRTDRQPAMRPTPFDIVFSRVELTNRSSSPSSVFCENEKASDAQTSKSPPVVGFSWYVVGL